tara:strand:- start:472 stop:1224 length:753 start_codon:yes stop_codon:yes gene_type:complete
MNFALILVLLSAITGLGYLIDVLFFARYRQEGEQPGRILEFCRSFFPVFFIVLLLRSFLVEPFRIPSGSLEPTLNVGDFVAVNKFAYGLKLPVLESKIIPIANPQKGQIAVFRWPPDPSYDYIKRVVGVPGDTVEYRNKVLYINGKKMEQTFVEYTTDESSGRTVAKYRENLAGVSHDIYVNPNVPAFDFKITVPQSQYFMMGDNRDDSADSRYWGYVAEEYLRGKAFLIWMSWNSKVSGVRWSRIGTII